MKKLFVLMFVGLCSQGFCMDFRAAPGGENFGSIGGQSMMEELSRLSDFFAHNDTGETPVESPAQAFREVTARMQNLMTFDQEHMRNFGIGAVNIAAGHTVSCDWIWGILEENSDSDDLNDDGDKLRAEDAGFNNEQHMRAFFYVTNFAYVNELYNVLALFMRNVVDDRVSDGQSKMISRMCKVIARCCNICRGVGMKLNSGN